MEPVLPNKTIEISINVDMQMDQIVFYINLDWLHISLTISAFKKGNSHSTHKVMREINKRKARRDRAREQRQSERSEGWPRKEG